MKVLVISASFPPMRSGGADYALRLCQELAKTGLQILVLTSNICNVATDPNFCVYPIMHHWSWREWPRLVRLVRHYRPDVINLHFVGPIYNNHPMITCVPFLLKKLLPGMRVVTHIEHTTGIQRDLSSRGKRFAGKIRASWRLMAMAAGLSQDNYDFGTILKYSDRIIILSDAHRVVLEHHLPGVGDKCDLIPPPPIMRVTDSANGAARRRGREMLGIKNDDFVLVYYGYIDPWKGLETLLQSFSLIRRLKQDITFKLVFVGGMNQFALKTCNRPHYGEELQVLAGQLEIANDLIWTGYYPTHSDEASYYLRAADVCVLPYRSGVYLNNSSFSAAAAHGLPIITTRGAVVEPAFIHGENLLLANPEDAKSLCAAMSSMVDDVDLRKHLSQGALHLAREWYSWHHATTRTIEAFTGLCSP